jgi:hypothetical protein
MHHVFEIVLRPGRHVTRFDVMESNRSCVCGTLAGSRLEASQNALM